MIVVLSGLRFRLLSILVLVALTSSCATSEYWIPPSSPPSQLAADHTQTGADLLAESNSAVIDFTASQGGSELLSILPDEGLFENSEKPDTNVPVIISRGTDSAPTPSGEIETVDSSPILYYAQAADTLPTVAVRFGVLESEITSTESIPEIGFINPGQLLIIPRKLGETTTPKHLFPDSEVVYSPSAIGFDLEGFVAEAGGYLSSFNEWHRSTGIQTGAETVQRVADENSINPRLLLALLEYQSGWVYGQPQGNDSKEYPMGYVNSRDKGLYNQLVWAVNQLSIGYYAYREGRMTEISFPDGEKARLAPDLNAGSAALQYFFAHFYQDQQWLDALDSETSLVSLYERMFGDPWKNAEKVEPLYPPGISQPALILPFVRGWEWAFTGGPHGAWERDGAYAGLDFAPGTQRQGCEPSGTWAVAAADGLVVRAGNGVVVLDLDGDGHEQTGWVLVYLHISTNGSIPLGSWVATEEQLGHPSCEGGISTGTHLHIARKYNGEWVPADGPIPFNLGGWVAHAGEQAYKGTLTRDGETVTACTCSNAETFISRGEDDP